MMLSTMPIIYICDVEEIMGKVCSVETVNYGAFWTMSGENKSIFEYIRLSKF